MSDMTIDIDTMEFQKDLDARGLNCPLPILKAKKALAEMESGQVLRIVQTGPVTDRDGFGNIVGHAKSVSDMSSLSSWTSQQFDPALSWKDVEWIKERWGGKLVIKGIMDPEDARLCVESGADALIVSNHGGRQLDGAISTAQALPAIAQAVKGKMTIFADGGVRTGTDVFRMLALGADGVLLGRAFIYALAVGGQAGVERLLAILEKDLRTNMVLTGVKSVREIGPHLLA